MYTKTVWKQATIPAISATNLNLREKQYENIIKIGEIIMYAGSTIPSDFFLCNGTSKQSTAYPLLFAVTSKSFGGSALSTWFNLPNLMGKFPVGFTGVGDYSTIGKTGGSSDVTISSSQLPPHFHYFDHSHGTVSGTYEHISGGLSNNINPTSTYNTGVAGGSGAHRNIPQCVSLQYLIRYQ